MQATNSKEYITQVKRLRTREHRNRTGHVIVEGYPEVSRAAKAKIPFVQLFICPEIFSDKDNEFAHFPVIEVDKDTFAQMAFGDRLKGILAICHPAEHTLENIVISDNPLIIILENVEKPGNLGAVLRTCDGAGVDAVFMCDSQTDIFNHNVVRSSLGTVFSVPTVKTTAALAYQYLSNNNVKVYAATAKGESIYSSTNLSGPAAIVVGNEHDGVSTFWFQNADGKITIPMYGAASSLNVSISASILIYEALRQRSSQL